MAKEILGGLFIFGIGITVGLNIQTNEIKNRYITLLKLREVVKNKNNKMVDHFAKLYSMTEHDESSFTEIDEMLASMWMD